jgi:hypothetical protein
MSFSVIPSQMIHTFVLMMAFQADIFQTGLEVRIQFAFVLAGVCPTRFLSYISSDFLGISIIGLCFSSCYKNFRLHLPRCYSSDLFIIHHDLVFI